MAPTRADAQLDQPLPAPPGRGEPAAAPKLTKPPAVKKQVAPTYPPEALDGGLAGDVTLTIDIAADGRVTAVAVTVSAGHGFDEAAVAAAREMEFFPAEIDGKPAAIRIGYTIHFQPKTVPVDAGAPPADAADAGRLLPRPGRRGTRSRPGGGATARGRAGPAARAGDARAPPRRRRGGDSPRSGIGRRRPARRGRGDDRRRRTVRGPPRHPTDASPGALRVIVSDTSHEPCVRDFTAAELGGPNPVEWLCYARARARGVNETRVRARPDHPEETRQTLSKAELTTVPGTIGDPLRVLQNMPGVARAPFGLGLLIVRGANPTDTGVFIGGEPIPVLYHFLAGPSVFTANLIDKIDFYPGGFGVRYGRFIGGVVDVGIKGDVGRHAARRRRRQPARLVGVRRRSGAGRRSHQLRRPPQLHRRAAAGDPPLLRPAARGLDLRHRRARVLGLSGARRQGCPRRAGGAARLRQQRFAGADRGQIRPSSSRPTRTSAFTT